MKSHSEECNATINTTHHFHDLYVQPSHAHHNHHPIHVARHLHAHTYENNGADDCSQHSANMYCSGYIDCDSDCNGSSCCFNTTRDSLTKADGGGRGFHKSL